MTCAPTTRAVNDWLEAIDLVLLRPPVLSRASEPMPMPLGTLDAIHLATALIWRDRVGSLLTGSSLAEAAEPRSWTRSLPSTPVR